jgi:hypothetical protein
MRLMKARTSSHFSASIDLNLFEYEEKVFFENNFYSYLLQIRV